MDTLRCCRQALRCGLLTLSLGLGVVTPRTVAQVTPRDRPAGVTDSAITWGEALFRGPANCSRCHGDRGRGTAYGPDLADAIWWHGPGSFEWLVREVTHGIPEQLTVTGGQMPARGWAPMNEADVQAVAAYVWAISHPPKPPLPEPPRRD
jgi:mono/diheme cytochrome c family protein